jgi:hypothetical protein
MNTNKLHRNETFTEYYFDVPDTTGKKEKTFIGQKQYKFDWNVEIKLNKELNTKNNKRVT